MVKRRPPGFAGDESFCSVEVGFSGCFVAPARGSSEGGMTVGDPSLLCEAEEPGLVEVDFDFPLHFILNEINS